MQTETQQTEATPVDATMEAASTPDKKPLPHCPGDVVLEEFAALDELFVTGTPTTEQQNRYDELAREITGHPTGEGVAGVLARLLIDHHKRGISSMEARADQIIESLHRVMRPAPETLRKDPTLAILPSGRKVSVRDVMDFERWTESATLRYSTGHLVMLDKADDIAALDAALGNIGVAVNAPTIAGEDRDGDGRTGE